MRGQDKQAVSMGSASVSPVGIPPTPPHTPPLASCAPLPTLTALPTEIVCHVFSYLSPPALAACALVAHPLLPLARAALYARLTLRNQRHGRAAAHDASPLDEPSSALLATLRTHPRSLARLAHALDFDLLSHVGADDVAALLASVFALCPALTSVRLGAGAHGHGLPFRGLHRALALSPAAAATAQRLTRLDVERCAGAPHTLALVLLEARELRALRIGQFLLEQDDWDLFCGKRAPHCRLESFVATGRITCTAFEFCTAASSASLRAVELPQCEHTALDLSRFSALSSVALSLFLASAPTPFSPAHAAFEPTMQRLARHFAATLASARTALVSRVSLAGAWDCAATAPPGASQAVDVVLHARLLERLPREGVREVVVRTELNAIALAAWLADDEWWGGPARAALPPEEEEPPGSPAASVASLAVSTNVPSPVGSPSPPPPSRSLSSSPGFPPASRRRADVAVLELWQKQSYSAARREFQHRVRERVEAGARERGVEVRWRMYERW
ncbi:F-box protein [Rhodotorula paludigena]|uniref:F-box protein n=1 Tax=Rhodotorula paludigena TaxID=86838 RepID=UPI00316F4FED